MVLPLPERAVLLAKEIEVKVALLNTDSKTQFQNMKK